MNFPKLFQVILYSYCNKFVCSSNWNLRKLYLRSIIPRSVTVFERHAVTVYCGSSNPVHWTISSYPLMPHREIGDPVHSRHSIKNKEITLFYLLEKDTGYYNCHGTYENSPFLKHSKITVVKEVPQGQVVPSLVETSQGSSVTLTCGSSKPAEWFSAHFHNQSIIAEGIKVTLHNLRKEHGGHYVCRGYKQPENIIFHSSAIIFVDGIVERVNEIHPPPISPLK